VHRRDEGVQLRALGGAEVKRDEHDVGRAVVDLGWQMGQRSELGSCGVKCTKRRGGVGGL